jgi:hypothetical protein
VDFFVRTRRASLSFPQDNGQQIPNLPGKQLPASLKRHHVHVHVKLPSLVAISAKRTTTGPVETQRGQNVEGQGARGRREGADMRHAGIHLQRTT